MALPRKMQIEIIKEDGLFIANIKSSGLKVMAAHTRIKSCLGKAVDAIKNEYEKKIREETVDG